MDLDKTNFLVFLVSKSSEIYLFLNSSSMIKLHSCKYLGLYIQGSFPKKELWER